MLIKSLCLDIACFSGVLCWKKVLYYVCLNIACVSFWRSVLERNVMSVFRKFVSLSVVLWVRGGTWVGGAFVLRRAWKQSHYWAWLVLRNYQLRYTSSSVVSRLHRVMNFSHNVSFYLNVMHRIGSLERCVQRPSCLQMFPTDRFRSTRRMK